MDIINEAVIYAAVIISNNVSEDCFKKLLENVFSVLTGKEEIHNINALYDSKPDIVKSAYGGLLKIGTVFGRNDLDKESVKSHLMVKCNFNEKRAGLFASTYDKNKKELQIRLANIGLHVAHVTDVNWEIDYIAKSSNIDQADGPLFRVCLITNKYDEASGSKKTEDIKFSCNSQELQDLVYKLKDAVKHCQKLVADH